MVNIAQFVYDAPTRHFIGEMAEVDGFEQVWPDSTDEGLVVVNPATGNRVTFVVSDESKDDEGDVQFWLLKSFTGTRTDGRFTMTVYND